MWALISWCWVLSFPCQSFSGARGPHLPSCVSRWICGGQLDLHLVFIWEYPHSWIVDFIENPSINGWFGVYPRFRKPPNGSMQSVKPSGKVLKIEKAKCAASTTCSWGCGLSTVSPIFFQARPKRGVKRYPEFWADHGEVWQFQVETNGDGSNFLSAMKTRNSDVLIFSVLLGKPSHFGAIK